MMRDKVLFVGGVADGKRMVCELLPQMQFPKPVKQESFDVINTGYNWTSDYYELQRFRDGDRFFYVYAWKNPGEQYSVLEKILDGYYAREEGE